MRRGFGTSAVGVAVLALMAVFTGQALGQTAEEWNKVIDAAKKEGRVVVYSAYVSPDTHQAINKAFEAKYGIKVDLLMARGTELRERVRTEQAAGRYIADVWHTAISNVESGPRDDQFTQPHGGLPGIANLKPEFAKRANDTLAPIFTINYGFLINSRLVKEGEEPKGWEDLLDPKWQGKILSDDPRASGGGRVMFHMTYDKFGRGFHEKLAKQNLVFNRDYQESIRRTARGEFPIYIPLILSQFAQLSGLPVRYVIPKEGVTYGSYGAPILKNPPHPNAARLMADFYLSDEAQLIYAKSAHGIVVKSLSEKLPPDIEKLANVTPLVDEDFTRINKMFSEAKDIYK